MVAKDFRLSSFFDSIYNASLPENNKSDKYLDKFDGVSTDAIDILLHAGITISQRHLDREKAAITDNHLIDAIAIPQVKPDDISIHNPKLIDFEIICTFLDHYYMRQMAKMFNDQFYYKISLDKKLENMTFHKYNDHIKE
ncbi:4434_t:CDS:2 [Cetraspora pellucida]|uniref:4434_t:CDS:1 n=1 Tax=Cetraspora pellucida TaxID=1433469 RepID=A0A9N9H9K8_9GLOM|nr:4434_t:CDS:2 [Cetraspora pellucida]